MCCSNKKKIQSPQPVAAKSLIPQNSVPDLAPNPNTSTLQIRQSTLQNSNIKVSQVPNPPSLFPNHTILQYQLQKQTQAHTSYVRRENYFDISEGHQKQLDSAQKVGGIEAAQYGTCDGVDLETPSMNKFCYDKNVVDISRIKNKVSY